MSFSTFSGPLRIGTVKDGDVTTRNTGVVVLAQTATVAASAMTTSPTAQNLFTIPAGAKIVRFNVEVVTAISGGGVTNVGLTLGKVGGTANFFTTTTNTGTSAAKLSTATMDGVLQVANTNNVGTTDVTVTGTFTAATGNPTAGAVVVTVEYLQRAADGAANPATV